MDKGTGKRSLEIVSFENNTNCRDESESAPYYLVVSQAIEPQAGESLLSIHNIQ
jgi:hypothetical protein